MSTSINKLTDKEVKGLKKKSKMFDGGGLYVLCTETGSKLWRLKYRHGGKEKVLSLGAYPHITLAQARDMRDTAKSQLANGIDPSAHKKEQKLRLALDATQTVKACSEAWIEHMTPKWGLGTKQAVISSFNRDVYPLIGNQSISTLTAKQIIDASKLVESRGATDQAARLLQRIKSFTRWATVNQLVDVNPSGDIKPDDVLKKRKVTNRPAIQQNQLHDFMVRIADYQGDAVVAAGIKFLALTALRPGEVRHLEWTDIDFENRTLTIPASRMKMGRAHWVPLSNQAIEILESMQPLNGRRKLVFSSQIKPNFPMSENTLNLGIQRMGFQATSHGMRSTFSTIAHESLNFKHEVIDAALAHGKKDVVSGKYDRSIYFNERIRLMQWWANYLDSMAVNKLENTTANVLT